MINWRSETEKRLPAKSEDLRSALLNRLRRLRGSGILGHKVVVRDTGKSVLKSNSMSLIRSQNVEAQYIKRSPQ